MGFDLKFLIYLVLYVMTAGGAVLVLAARDTVKSAMALVLVMVSLAGHFFLMGQEFVGAIQIIVYAGAIMVLFLFVIMLLNVRELEYAPWYMKTTRMWAMVLAIAFFLLTTFAIGAAGATAPEGLRPGSALSIAQLATLLTTKYFLPFLLTSVLLLVAVIGAVVMGRRSDPETGEEYIPLAEE